MKIKFNRENFDRLVIRHEATNKVLETAYDASRSNLKNVNQNLDKLNTELYELRNLGFKYPLEHEADIREIEATDDHMPVHIFKDYCLNGGYSDVFGYALKADANTVNLDSKFMPSHYLKNMNEYKNVSHVVWVKNKNP